MPIVSAQPSQLASLPYLAFRSVANVGPSATPLPILCMPMQPVHAGLESWAPVGQSVLSAVDVVILQEISLGERLEDGTQLSDEKLEAPPAQAENVESVGFDRSFNTSTSEEKVLVSKSRLEPK